MATSDQVAFVQSKLTAGETVVSCQEASLMKEWVRASRILVLTEHGGNHAFLVYIPNKIPPQAASDLTLEQVLPIDAEFRCEIDPDCKYQDAVDVYVNISSKKLKLLFEMVPGVKTSNFVEEVFRAVEVFTKHRGPPPEFTWLQAYQPSILTNRTSGDSSKFDSADSSESGQEQLDKQSVELHNESRNAKKWSTYYSLLELENSDLVVPRQSIAKGITPIAARESVIRYQMAMKEDDYTDTQIFRIFVGTWNVNGQPPNNVGLNEWLQHDEEPPDLYAIGFQELDLSKEAFLFNDTPREEEWMRAVINALHPKGRYLKVRLVRLVGMMLLVFVQEQHRAYIRHIASETVGTGIMGKMGNKGGVAIRLDLHSTSICFVNSHLAAHVEEYARRNQDYHDIYTRLVFSHFAPPKAIKDHDQVYWLGDLNYRVNLDAKVVKDYVIQENFAPVLEYDQLKQQHGLKQVFAGYQEGPINFKPTYKYDPGTDDWDSSEKNRAPAWCDRILWKGDGISLSEYRSHPELKLSDHKPVSCIFDSEVRVIDSAKYRRIHEDVMKKLDKLENEFLPQVMVDNTEIVLDTVRYLEPQKKELIIANTGQVPVQFEFIKKLDDKSFCKGWLSIEPYLGFIMPGEKSDITLEVYVDKKSACKLNSGEDKLYDILVLHLEGGKDIFITVTGTYERSCFGLSIEALVYITVPIRDIPVGKLMELENGTCREAPGGQDPYPVPKEIWFLVDHLYRNGLDQQHLFEHPGLHSELVNIRNWLDAGSADPLPGSVHSVAESLLLLLESTSEPLVPYNLHDVCLHSASNYLQCKQLVQEQLPEHRKNVFLYLCSFLQEVLNHSDKNGLDAKFLATLFGGIFLREPPRTSGGAGKPRSHQQDRKKANFVYHFLVNNQSDFILNR